MKKIIFKIFLFLVFTNISLVKAEIDFELKTGIIQDTLSGKILYEKDPELPIYPASMTKIMTTLIAFELLKSGEITLDEKFTISEKAWRMSTSGYSSMFVMLNDEVSVENLLLGIIIVSGNDACVALAEGISGSEEEFVVLMNTKAAEIGMEDTNFENASGLPNSRQVTTAYDMAKLMMALMRDFPEYYHLFSIDSFLFKRSFYKNHNYVRTHLDGIDGSKTGYTSKAGWNIMTTAKRGGVRLIGILLGGSTRRSRDRVVVNLMNKYFAKFRRIGSNLHELA